MNRHQYDSFKQHLLRCNGIPSREKSPRARFFHRRQPRDLNQYDRNGGIRNDRGNRRRRPAEIAVVSKTTNHEQNIENLDNKQKPRRRFNRNRKPKNAAEQTKNDAMPESILTEKNLTTLLCELSLGNNSLITANSTSSDSLDFEKINKEDTPDADLCSGVLSSAASRLAASFNKGN